MPSLVGGIDSIRDNQNDLNDPHDYYRLSDTFTKIAPMTSWSIGTSGIPLGWTVLDYENSKFARPA